MICKSEIAPSKIAVMAPTEIAVAPFFSGGDVVVSDFNFGGVKTFENLPRSCIHRSYLWGGGWEFYGFFLFWNVPGHITISRFDIPGDITIHSNPRLRELRSCSPA